MAASTFELSLAIAVCVTIPRDQSRCWLTVASQTHLGHPRYCLPMSCYVKGGMFNTHRVTGILGLLSFYDESDILDTTVVDLLGATNTYSIAFTGVSPPLVGVVAEVIVELLVAPLPC
jgi:hypothetical protein